MGIRDNHGQWQIRFQLGGPPVSHSTGLKATAANRSVARRLEADLRLAMRTGTKLTTISIGCSDAIDRYLEWASEEMKPATYAGHKVSLGQLKKFVESELSGRLVSQVTAGDLELWKSLRRYGAVGRR